MPASAESLNATVSNWLVRATGALVVWVEVTASRLALPRTVIMVASDRVLIFIMDFHKVLTEQRPVKLQKNGVVAQFEISLALAIC
jgi:hypothetical protein